MRSMAAHEGLWVGRTRPRAFYVLALLVVALIGVLAAAKPAHAATFTVNSTGDAGDVTVGDNVCDSDPTATVTCTLRAAIQQSNASTTIDDTINFGIPASGCTSATGVCTITPVPQLPIITDTVTINGYTQGGAAANTTTTNSNNAVLKVEINGTSAGTVPLADGLILSGNGGAAGSVIKGLVINRFSGNGVRAEAGAAVTVEGNFIGTDPTGTLDRGNGFDGVLLFGSNNVIGGAANAAQNVISGNAVTGVSVVGVGATGNVVSNNHIGTDADAGADLGNTRHGVFVTSPGTLVGGSSADGAHNIISGNDEHGVLVDGAEGAKILGNLIGLNRNGNGFSNIGNTLDGVRVEDAPGVEIGGTQAGQGNTISDNGESGLNIVGAGSGGGKVQGNRIGTSASGVASLAGNGGRGVFVEDASDALIGGTSAGARNVISGNALDGVVIIGAEATNNRIEGNFIGTDGTGVNDVGNQQGVNIFGASGNFVGGTSVGAGNLISGNRVRGVIVSADAADNRIQGNRIGTNAAGIAVVGNGAAGVDIESGSGTLVGGTSAGARNVISGNDGNGIEIDRSSDNRVQGNFIGTKSDGTGDLGNTLNGVVIQDFGNTVGGGVAEAGNVISGNDGDGVVVTGANALNNRILRNSIFANTGLGIDLVGGTENAAGATANDPQDPDTGPNGLQNKPAIGSATTTGSSLTLSGNLNSRPGKTFAIQFFSNPSGNEGKKFLGQRSVTTNANGNAPYTFTLSVSVAVGETITATATGGGNTSEFSGPRVAQSP